MQYIVPPLTRCVQNLVSCYAPPIIGGSIKRWCCLTSDDVWRLSRTSGLSREERPRKTKIGTEVAHVTRDLDSAFKVKRSKVNVTRPLCSPPCWSVRRLQRWAMHGNVWPWETAATLPSAWRRKPFAHRGEDGRAARGISWRPPAYSLFESADSWYWLSQPQILMLRGSATFCLLLYCGPAHINSTTSLIGKYSAYYYASAPIGRRQY